MAEYHLMFTKINPNYKFHYYYICILMYQLNINRTGFMVKFQMDIMNLSIPI